MPKPTTTSGIREDHKHGIVAVFHKVNEQHLLLASPRPGIEAIPI